MDKSVWQGILTSASLVNQQICCIYTFCINWNFSYIFDHSCLQINENRKQPDKDKIQRFSLGFDLSDYPIIDSDSIHPMPHSNLIL